MVEFTSDTDIGSDVDDLMALVMVLGSPEMNVRAVTTLYGDTLLRARIVRRAYAVAGRPAPPVAAVARETRSGWPVWWAGHEGAMMRGLYSLPGCRTRSRPSRRPELWGSCSRPRSVSSGPGLAGRTARTTRSPSWPPYDPSCSPSPAAGSG
jgi:hypothetical protein